MSQNSKNWLILFVIVAIILLIDQGTKLWVVNNLELQESVRPIEFLYPFFQITRSSNTGAAFGLLQDAGILFPLLPILIVLFMLFYFPRIKPNTWLTKIAAGLVIGGALGNIIDRLQYDHVVDFIHYQIPGLISNVSNIADHAIVIGVFLLLLDSWIRERRKSPDESDNSETVPIEPNSSG